jgi:sulfite reductase (ferredoxin)
MGVGECAGEVVSQAQFTLAASEREIFEAQIWFDAGDLRKAATLAYDAMVRAAEALVKMQDDDATSDQENIVAQFRRLFCDTQLFYDKYAGSTFADYLFKARDAVRELDGIRKEVALQRLQEAQLFIDAAHSCYNKIAAGAAAAPAAPAPLAEARSA